MPLQQGACLSKQGAIVREWLRLEPRHALSAPFKTMPLRCLCSFVPLALLSSHLPVLTSHFSFSPIFPLSHTPTFIYIFFICLSFFTTTRLSYVFTFYFILFSFCFSNSYSIFGKKEYLWKKIVLEFTYFFQLCFFYDLI